MLISSEPNHVTLEQNNVSFHGNEIKKRKWVTKKELQVKTKAKKIGNRTNRKGDEITLLRMHQENMVVLKNINENIARIADGQETFLKKINLCPRCSAARPNENFESEINF